MGQRVPVDNATLSMVEKEFGDLQDGDITHGTVKILAAGAVVKPQYGDSPQYYSASIPFIADYSAPRKPTICRGVFSVCSGSVARSSYQDTGLNIIEVLHHNSETIM